MKTALIIHGHFYQPPRENPFTGFIGIQESASPYENWNEAIYQTCYRPNANSRYLDSNGKILSIINNYESISSNFGPTLLNWIEEKHPDFINKLQDSDKASIRKYGHSNFIAQCYNHTILPLDPPEIKKIQIKWALDDYEKRFKHKSEGFWCSECAIDEDTIDELADNGIKFVILSPWQAIAINGMNLKGQPAPCDRPFKINGKRNSIAAFFYDPDLASGISFGHYLQDADRLYEHLKEIKKNRSNPKLINCATDGEIYGHHEPFGDMALAALIKKVNSRDDFYFTNYGAFLEQNPPCETAELFKGEDGKGSSWSCSHGVKRWYDDCGCHTGGPENWNQKWRTPLRLAFNNFENRARKITETYIKETFGKKADFTDTMISYGKVVCKLCSYDEFCQSEASLYNVTVDSENQKTLKTILTSYTKVLFSFTSCGWFFNDISGIEPRQNIMYAVFAARNLQPYTKEKLLDSLLSDLDKVKGNRIEDGTAKDLAIKDFENISYDKFALPVTSNRAVEKIIGHFASEIKETGIHYYQIKLIVSTIVNLRKDGFNPDITELQNAVYPYLSGLKKSLHFPLVKKLLAEQLNFSYDLF